jgi:hypothetical protein
MRLNKPPRDLCRTADRPKYTQRDTDAWDWWGGDSSTLTKPFELLKRHPHSSVMALGSSIPRSVTPLNLLALRRILEVAALPRTGFPAPPQPFSSRQKMSAIRSLACLQDKTAEACSSLKEHHTHITPLPYLHYKYRPHERISTTSPFSVLTRLPATVYSTALYHFHLYTADCNDDHLLQIILLVIIITVEDRRGKKAPP